MFPDLSSALLAEAKRIQVRVGQGKLEPHGLPGELVQVTFGLPRYHALAFVAVDRAHVVECKIRQEYERARAEEVL